MLAGTIGPPLVLGAAPAGADAHCTSARYCTEVIVTAADVNNWISTPVKGEYYVRIKPNYAATDFGPLTGISLIDVAKHASPAGIPPNEIHYAVITSGGAGRSAVTGAHLLAAAQGNSRSGPYQNGMAPVIYADGGEARYFRPLLAGSLDDGTDPADTNGTENLLQPPITVDIFTNGMLISPTLTATQKSVQPKTPVGFTITGGGCTDHSVKDETDFHYGDGGKGKQYGNGSGGASVTHRYQDPGDDYAYADVYCADGSGGETNTVHVHVIGAKPTKITKTHSTSPRGNDGGGPQNNGAPTSQSEPPTIIGLESSSSVPPTGPVGTGVGGPAAPTGSGSAAGSASPSARASGVPTATSTAVRHGRAGDAGGERVIGYLIDPVAGGAPAGSAAPPRPASSPDRSPPPVTPGHIAEIALSIVGVLVLLAYGAGAEWRRPWRRAPKRR